MVTYIDECLVSKKLLGVRVHTRNEYSLPLGPTEPTATAKKEW